MKIICSGRCTGKTTRLIKESNKTGQYILVSNKIQADCVAKLARKLELNIPYPITVYEMLNNRVGGIVKRRGILVDEAQHILEKVLDSKINVMTINAEETDDEVKEKHYVLQDQEEPGFYLSHLEMSPKYKYNPEIRTTSIEDLRIKFTDKDIANYVAKLAEMTVEEVDAE